MWLESLILKKAEKKLVPYRHQVSLLNREISEEYRELSSEIEKLYQSTTHWHGTGRHHYNHQNGSRYSEVNLDKTIDILEQIFKSNGLIPHHDPWIDSNGKTVSLATTRMHARAFARIHASDNEILFYELGSVKFWLRFYFALLFIWLFANFWSHRKFIKDTLRSSFSKDVQNWASAIRKPKKGKVISILDMFKGEIPTSDIDNNYPILIGIKADPSKLIETIPLTHKVEQRSLRSITLEMFTHIEVPSKKVAETKDLLNKHHVQLPVLPLEFGDMYLASTSLRELAFS